MLKGNDLHIKNIPIIFIWVQSLVGDLVAFDPLEEIIHNSLPVSLWVIWAGHLHILEKNRSITAKVTRWPFIQEPRRWMSGQVPWNSPRYWLQSPLGHYTPTPRKTPAEKHQAHHTSWPSSPGATVSPWTHVSAKSPAFVQVTQSL